MENETDGALLRGRPIPGNVTVKLVYLPNLLLRLVHPVQVFLVHLSRLLIILSALEGSGNLAVLSFQMSIELARSHSA